MSRRCLPTARDVKEKEKEGLVVAVAYTVVDLRAGGSSSSLSSRRNTPRVNKFAFTSAVDTSLHTPNQSNKTRVYVNLGRAPLFESSETTGTCACIMDHAPPPLPRPHAVVIHAQHALVAHAAVVRARRLVPLTLLAVPRPALALELEKRPASLGAGVSRRDEFVVRFRFTLL